MTGLSVYGNYIYLGSRNQNRAYRYTLPNITTRTDYAQFTGASETCDIAVNPDDGIVWVASESSMVPIRCYDTSGTMVDYFDNSLISNARGLTLDPDGYLWVSDIDNDKIYKVDLTEGVAGGGPATPLNVAPSSNPFSSAVTLQASGVTATVTIFDMYGRQVEQDSFQESWTWNSSAPAGSYIFVVTDDGGNTETLELIKI